MAAIDITISGVLYDKYSRTARPVVLIGEASYTGLGIGGGPVLPPGSSEPPLEIWGPNDPRPTPPIHIPPMPPEPPPGNVVKPPPPDGGWAFVPPYGWGYFPKPSEPGPKK